MKHEIILVCEPSFVTEWFAILERGGLEVTLRAAAPPQEFAGLGAITYRSGTVSQDAMVVDIWSHPGQHPQAGTPLAGKCILMLQPHAQQHRPLADRIVEILTAAGMTLMSRNDA